MGFPSYSSMLLKKYPNIFDDSIDSIVFVENIKYGRELNPAMRASIDLKAYIKEMVGEKQKLNNVAAMSKVAWKILKENDTDLEKSKKAFNIDSFLKDYDEAVKEVEKNREAKRLARA